MPNDCITPIAVIDHFRERHPATYRRRLASLGASDDHENEEHVLAIFRDVGENLVTAR